MLNPIHPGPLPHGSSVTGCHNTQVVGGSAGALRPVLETHNTVIEESYSSVLWPLLHCITSLSALQVGSSREEAGNPTNTTSVAEYT